LIWKLNRSIKQRTITIDVIVLLIKVFLLSYKICLIYAIKLDGSGMFLNAKPVFFREGQAPFLHSIVIEISGSSRAMPSFYFHL
jgi:hypothetical protein